MQRITVNAGPQHCLIDAEYRLTLANGMVYLVRRWRPLSAPEGTIEVMFYSYGFVTPSPYGEHAQYMHETVNHLPRYYFPYDVWDALLER